MSLKSALETAKEILEQASLEEGMHDKKKGDKDTDTKAAGLEGGAVSADGVEPKAADTTDKKAKRPVMQKTDATGEAGAEEEDMHGGEEEDMHGGEEEDMHAMTPGEEEYE